MAQVKVTITLNDRVSSKLKQINSQMSRTESTGTRAGFSVSSAFDRVKTSADKVYRSFSSTNKISLAPLKKQLMGLASTVQSLNRHTNQLTQTVAMLAKTYLGVMGAKAALETSDSIISARNRIGDSNGTGWASQETTETLQKIYGAANRARTSYTDMMTYVGKSMALAGDAFDNNVDNAIRFQEIMGKAYAISGASAEEMSSSMYQLQQALSSGILQGDELRSVREGATLAYKEIEKFAQKLYNTDESLKEMGSKGMITSDIVTAAILQAGDTIDARFAQTRMTFSQMWTLFKNETIEAFRPVFEKLNEIANSPAFQKIAAGVSDLINNSANAFIVILNIVQIVVNFIADHWAWVSKIILFFIGIMVSSLIIWAIKGIWAFTIVGLKAAWFIIKLALTVVWYGVLAVAAWMSATLQGAAWAYVLWAVLVFILAVMTIGYVYAEITGKTFSFAGTLVGIWYWIKGAVTNVWVTIYNGAMWCCERIVYGWNSMCYGMSSFMAGTANLLLNIWDGIVNYLIDKVNGFLSLINMVISGVNKVTGKNIGTIELLGSYSTDRSGISSLAGTKPTMPNYGRKSYVNLGEAFDTGYDVGSNWWSNTTSGISNWWDKLTTNLTSGSGGSPTSMPIDPSKVGATDLPAGVGGTGSGGSGSSGGSSSVPSSVGKIATNTDDIADSLDNLEEDFSYLIEIAERDAINRFTTASINVDMTNHNTISQNMDIDGIIDTLSSRLAEELSVVAAGTHY